MTFRIRAAASVAVAGALVSLSLVTTVPAEAAATYCQDSIGTYRVQWNSGSNYLSWNGVFQGQMRETGQATTFQVYGCPNDGTEVYQFELLGSNNLCLEYDGTDTAVIADTCTDTRTSQQWSAQLGVSAVTFGGATCGKMFVNTPGDQVNCNSVITGQTWTVYAHSA